MLANCEPNDYISNDPALPTIATLRLEWAELEIQRGDKEIDKFYSKLRSDFDAIKAETDSVMKKHGIDIETAGEPDEWVCPPECEACHNSGAACGLCGGGNYGDAQSDTCQHCDDGWEPCDCGSEDGRHSESCAMGPCRYCGGAK